MNGVFDLPLVIFPAEILQRLGYQSNQMLMRKVRNVLMDAMDEARALAHPKAMICTLPIVWEDRMMHLEGTDLQLQDRDLLDWAQNCTRLSVFAVTLGAEISHKIQEYAAQEEDVKADVLEAVRTDALDQAVNLLRDRCITQGIADGFQVTQCFDWNAEDALASGRMQWLHFLKAQAASAGADFDENSAQTFVGMVGWIPFEVFGQFDR